MELGKNHTWIENPNYQSVGGKLYFHSTSVKNTKAIFHQGLIPGKSKGQFKSPEIWAWDKSFDQFMSTWIGKKEDVIVIDLKPDEIQKMPDSSVVRVTAFEIVPVDRIKGAIHRIATIREMIELVNLYS